MAEDRNTPVHPDDLPRLCGAPGLDSHAHLDMLPDPAGALVRAAQVGVRLVLTVVDLTETGEEGLDELPLLLHSASEQLAAASTGEASGLPHDPPLGVPEVRAVIGVHPHNASAWTEEIAAQMLTLAARPEVVAFGEVGLDFHYDSSPRDVQIAMFREQLMLAHEAGVPVIVHLRDAHEAGEEILREIGVPPAGAVLHCFTEGPEWARRFLALGCHISFSGLATFKKADAIRSAVAVVPLDRILLETDAPFLAPEPYRGRSNEPSLVTLTTHRVAEVLRIPAEDLVSAAYRNARKLFALDAPVG